MLLIRVQKDDLDFYLELRQEFERGGGYNEWCRGEIRKLYIDQQWCCSIFIPTVRTNVYSKGGRGL